MCSKRKEGSTKLQELNKSLSASEMFGQESDEDCVRDPVPSIPSCKKNHTYCSNNDDTNRPFIIYHQNIQDLNGKVNEFILSLLPEVPHLICLSEHHLKYDEINATHIPAYKLGATYCRTSLKCGGVCIYTNETIKATHINIQQHNKEQD